MQGRVWLAGSGPGDPGLVTLKLAEILKIADVVVYDRLVSSEILEMSHAKAQRIFVGKRTDSHEKSQQEINEILVQEALKGHQVLRLKGGDPFVFGRGAEELAELLAAGIPCEVIPGITSAIAVPEFAGIPVTFRQMSRSFHVFTGHTADLGVPDFDFEAMVRIGGTLIFLMATQNSLKICEGLIQAGMEPETPSAVLRSFLPGEDLKCISTVKDLPSLIEKEKISAPAVLVIGEVVRLSSQLSWRT